MICTNLATFDVISWYLDLEVLTRIFEGHETSNDMPQCFSSGQSGCDLGGFCNRIFVLSHKFVLRTDKFIRLVVIEELQDDLEERERIEVKEEAKESLIRQETHDIVDIAAPLERAKWAWWELFALDKEADDPHELVPNVGLAMLNVELFSAVLHVAVFVVGVSSFRFFLYSCFTGITCCSFI